jgi:hypothetical protein
MDSNNDAFRAYGFGRGALSAALKTKKSGGQPFDWYGKLNFVHQLFSRRLSFPERAENQGLEEMEQEHHRQTAGEGGRLRGNCFWGEGR